MSKLKVLVTDAIDPEGLRPLEKRADIDLRYELAPAPDLLEKALHDTEAWLVRSETKVTRDWIGKAKALRLIGRAGVGVDNIDVQAATLRGIAVVNAPAANTIAACEHAFGLMLSLARNIPQADAHVKASQWKRSQFMGVELHGKTLGIVGLGRIGREMAKRALAFGMTVVGFDPFVSSELAAELGVELAGLDRLLGKSDFITLHAPGSDKTKHLLDAAAFSKIKAGARLINCARGELIEPKALAEALSSGRLAGAALDVFEKEPLPADSVLRTAPNLILTPHLGASTREAQAKVATELAESVIAFQEKGLALNALNLPGFDGDTIKSLGGLLDLAEKLGRFVGQMVDAGLREVACSFEGEFSPGQRRPLSVAALKGVLSALNVQGVSYISAPAVAAERGVKVSESAQARARGGYRQLLTVSAKTDRGSVSVAGALIAPNEPRVVLLNELAVEVRPEGKLLVVTNRDTPGVIGRIGTLLGENKINIADMRVGRMAPHGEAVMVLTVDEEATAPVRAKLEEIPGITSVRWVKL